jgi:hypothetical protein
MGAGFDDGAVVGEPVQDGGAEPASVKVLAHPVNDSFDAIATDAFSPRSISTWKSSSAPRAGPATSPATPGASHNRSPTANPAPQQRYPPAWQALSN